MIEITFHHDTHHAAYVNNLNLALAKHPELAGKSLKGLLMDLNAIPEEFSIAERNHGGGSWNHDLFWQLMAPEMGGEPQGELKKKPYPPPSAPLITSKLSSRSLAWIASAPVGLGWSRWATDW